MSTNIYVLFETFSNPNCICVLFETFYNPNCINTLLTCIQSRGGTSHSRSNTKIFPSSVGLPHFNYIFVANQPNIPSDYIVKRTFNTWIQYHFPLPLPHQGELRL